MQKKIKVVMAKMGLDSHYRGAIMVSKYLSDRGMEVVYIGNQVPEAIVSTVAQEDAAVLGLSSLSGNHLVMVPRVMQKMREAGLDDVLVVIGGVIPPDDREALRAAGVHGVFGTGASLEDIASFIEERAGRMATAQEQDEVRQEVSGNG
jgi:methylmalonyl-CoA mutase C-terminal domain/subunit